MTQNEAIEIREKLLAEQRRLNAAVKVLNLILVRQMQVFVWLLASIRHEFL